MTLVGDEDAAYVGFARLERRPKFGGKLGAVRCGARIVKAQLGRTVRGVQRTSREAYEIGDDVRVWVKRREASRQLLDGAPLLSTGQPAFALHSSKGVARSGYHNLDGARATD